MSETIKSLVLLLKQAQLFIECLKDTWDWGQGKRVPKPDDAGDDWPEGGPEFQDLKDTGSWIQLLIGILKNRDDASDDTTPQ